MILALSLKRHEDAVGPRPFSVTVAQCSRVPEGLKQAMQVSNAHDKFCRQTYRNTGDKELAKMAHRQGIVYSTQPQQKGQGKGGNHSKGFPERRVEADPWNGPCQDQQQWRGNQPWSNQPYEAWALLSRHGRVSSSRSRPTPSTAARDIAAPATATGPADPGAASSKPMGCVGAAAPVSWQWEDFEDDARRCFLRLIHSRWWIIAGASLVLLCARRSAVQAVILLGSSNCSRSCRSWRCRKKWVASVWL